MFRSYRLFKLTTRGLLVGAVLWSNASLAQETKDVLPSVLESQPITESGHDTSKEQRKEQRQEEKHPTEKLTPAINKIESAIRDFITQQNTAQSQGPKDNEIRDLKAQEGMALWAKAMFWTSLAMAAITFVGILLIGWTLRETRRAANYTKGMLKEAKKTTIAAQDTAKGQQEAFNKLERPYLFVEPTNIMPMLKPGKEEVPFVKYSITNFGKLPATLRAVSVVLMPYKNLTFKDGGPVLEPWNNHSNYRIIGQNYTFDDFSARLFGGTAGVGLTPKAVGTETIALMGTIFYEDPTGALHIDEFMLLSDSKYESFRMEWANSKTYRGEEKKEQSKRLPAW